ncbi:hypothetical protein NQZ68_028566 [Dissostichus eleginoides]|nr:hypothetical protein NQZ68_028566 [Dissostichus eleginoides]
MSFLDLVTLEDGKADSVVAAIKSALQKKELPVDRLYGLRTDGAAVMTGGERYKVAIAGPSRSKPPEEPSSCAGCSGRRSEHKEVPSGQRTIHLLCHRFVAALYLQADVLPHIAMLSKVFQRADVNVPVTLVTLGSILEAGETPLPGTFLARLQQDLDHPGGLGAFSIAGEEERSRRGHGNLERPREEL